MNDKVDKKGPEVKFPPPFIFILSFIVAYGFDNLYPIRIEDSSVLVYIGAVMILLSLGAILYVVFNFRVAKTNIEPWKPTTAIIKTGVYAYSRNPIYVGFCTFTIGVGFVLNSLWVVISFVPAAWVLMKIVIKKEEAYLEKKFGLEYDEYKKRVRRWL